MVLIVQTELFLYSITASSQIKLMLKFPDISRIYYRIQGLDSYNLLTEKVLEKVP